MKFRKQQHQTHIIGILYVSKVLFIVHIFGVQKIFKHHQWPFVLLICFSLECRHVPVHRAPACAPLMQHSWSTGRRGGGGTPRPTLAAAAEYNGRRCWAPDSSVDWPRCGLSNDSFAHNNHKWWLAKICHFWPTKTWTLHNKVEYTWSWLLLILMKSVSNW